MTAMDILYRHTKTHRPSLWLVLAGLFNATPPARLPKQDPRDLPPHLRRDIGLEDVPYPARRP